MQALKRVLAALLCVGIAAQSSPAQVRTVAVEPGPGPAPAGVGAAPSQTLPQSLSLPSLSIGQLGASASLPSVKGPAVSLRTPQPALAAADAAALRPVGASPSPVSTPHPALPTSAIPAAVAPRTGAAASQAAPAAVSPRAVPGVATAGVGTVGNGTVPTAQGPSQKSSFSRRVTALAGTVAEAGRQLALPAADGGRAAAERQFQTLAGEASREPSADPVLRVDGLDFSEAQLSQVRAANTALVSGVESAIGAVLPEGGFQVRSRGSSARLTYTGEQPDYDLMVRLPGSMDNAAVGKFVHDHLAAIKQAVAEQVSGRTAALYGDGIEVVVTGPKLLSDPATHKPSEGVFLLEVSVRGPAGPLIDADVTLTSRRDYANDYPDYFAAQMEQVRRAGGPQAVERTLRDIRLAKRLFTVLLGSYKPWHGGPSGVGVEQLILQSGKVSDSDRGRTILETGSFDRFMARIHEIAFESDGAARGLKKARRLWTVHNPFMEPASFLDLLSEGAWKQLSYASRRYAEARQAGLSLDLRDLRYDKPEAPVMPVRPVERQIPVLEAAPNAQLRVAVRSTMVLAKWTRQLAALQSQLRGRGIPVMGMEFRYDGQRALVAALDLSPAADMAAAEAALRAALKRADPRAELGEAAKGVSQRPVPDVTFFIKARYGRLPAGDGGDKVVRGLSRRFDLSPRSRGLSRDAAGNMALSFAGKIGDREAFVKEAAEYIASRPGGLELAAVSFPARQGAPSPEGSRSPLPEGTAAAEAAEPVQASPAQAAKAAPAASPADGAGSLTLGMLKKFTLNGPAPEARGDEYLYAQGAKVLPEGLETARYDGRTVETKKTDKSQTLRTLLLRRGGRTYVMAPDFNEEGIEIYKPLKVPPELAKGIVSESMVEVSYEDKKVLSVRSIGAYPADMLIGRAVRQGGGLAFVGLFGAGDSTRALFPPLPIGKGAAVREGDIVQAFIRSGAAGAEAVPLKSLGREVTPEIAAREIALRHGARGYFDEGVVRQAELVGRSQDPESDFRRMREAKGRVEDLRGLPFVTIDPVGAGDLDDAFAVEKGPDGSFTWYLATADVAQYVKPGTPAFEAAARIGNTFYSIDKDGVPEFPMNHPVVSKYVASLLAGKDSLAMITKMKFSPTGEFLLKDSEVFLGLVSVKGRYTYDQVAALWKGRADHGIVHMDQVALARELSQKLNQQDTERGKLKLFFTQYEHRKGPDGRWATQAVEEDPLLGESHRLIEELKVYGNRVIATRLDRITEQFKVPHVSRVHPPAEDSVNERLHKELSELGAPWPKNIPLWKYLADVHGRKDLSPEKKEVIQTLALRSRSSALYALDDADGHEGLALQAGEYDHPSTPIRRFSDMYNRAILEAYLESGDPTAVYNAVIDDLRSMGFASFEEYLQHLNGREQASKRMDYDVDEFMSVYTLAKPENVGRTFGGYVKLLKEGKNAEAVIQLRGVPAFITLRGDEARGYRLLQEVQVTVRGADIDTLEVDAKVSRGK